MSISNISSTSNTIISKDYFSKLPTTIINEIFLFFEFKDFPNILVNRRFKRLSVRAINSILKVCFPLIFQSEVKLTLRQKNQEPQILSSIPQPIPNTKAHFVQPDFSEVFFLNDRICLWNPENRNNLKTITAFSFHELGSSEECSIKIHYIFFALKIDDKIFFKGNFWEEYKPYDFLAYLDSNSLTGAKALIIRKNNSPQGYDEDSLSVAKNSTMLFEYGSEDKLCCYKVNKEVRKKWVLRAKIIQAEANNQWLAVIYIQKYDVLEFETPSTLEIGPLYSSKAAKLGVIDLIKNKKIMDVTIDKNYRGNRDFKLFLDSNFLAVQRLGVISIWHLPTRKSFQYKYFLKTYLHFNVCSSVSIEPQRITLIDDTNALILECCKKFDLISEQNNLKG